ncbi:MAG: hypothetical protein Q9212_007398 [Teloschistes hypoglaucus]
MKFASAIVAVSTFGSLVLAAPAPVAFIDEPDVEQVVKRDDYGLRLGFAHVKLVTYSGQNCGGSQNFDDDVEWSFNHVTDPFRSYLLSRDLAPNEVLDFSGTVHALVRRDVNEVAESSPREESPLEKRSLNSMCALFLQHAEGDGRKAGCHNTKTSSNTCYRLWRHIDSARLQRPNKIGIPPPGKSG